MFMTLLFAQLVTAHHNTVHLDHEHSFIFNTSENSGSHDGDDQKAYKHACPQCLLSKSLNVTLSLTQVSDAYVAIEKLKLGTASDKAPIILVSKYTHARGPPTLLI